MMLKHFAIQSIFTEDEYDLEGYRIPSGIKEILTHISDDIFNNNFWQKVPHSIQEMIDLDSVKNEEDGYRFYVDTGDFTWISSSMSFYLDINQYMLLDPKLKDEYSFKLSDNYLSCEIYMHISNIYNEPTLVDIGLDVSMEGDVESFELYPNCKLKYPMTRDEIVNKFGDVYEED